MLIPCVVSPGAKFSTNLSAAALLGYRFSSKARPEPKDSFVNLACALPDQIEVLVPLPDDNLMKLPRATSALTTFVSVNPFTVTSFTLVCSSALVPCLRDWGDGLESR